MKQRPSPVTCTVVVRATGVLDVVRAWCGLEDPITTAPITKEELEAPITTAGYRCTGVGYRAYRTRMVTGLTGLGWLQGLQDSDGYRAYRTRMVTGLTGLGWLQGLQDTVVVRATGVLDVRIYRGVRVSLVSVLSRIGMCARVRGCVRAHARTHAHKCTHSRRPLPLHIYGRTHARTHAHTHRRTHARSHARTHVRFLASSPCSYLRPHARAHTRARAHTHLRARQASVCARLDARKADAAQEGGRVGTRRDLAPRPPPPYARPQTPGRRSRALLRPGAPHGPGTRTAVIAASRGRDHDVMRESRRRRAPRRCAFHVHRP
jgi:hypothetical protein